MAQPRLQHYVAKLYQRGFARRTGKRSWQARVIDRSTGADETRNIEKVFALPHWNSITDAEGNRDATVEVNLAERIDGPAAPGIQAMRAGTLPDDEDRLPVADFMAAQLTRGTAVRESLAEFSTEVQRMAMKMAVANYSDEQWIEMIGEVPSPELKDQLMHNEELFDIQPTNAALLPALFGSITESPFRCPRDTDGTTGGGRDSRRDPSPPVLLESCAFPWLVKPQTPRRAHGRPHGHRKSRV